MVGDRLWYIHKIGMPPQPFIVSIVYSERSVTGLSIDAQGWSFARQRIYVKQLPSENPAPPYAMWPEKKLNT